MSIQKLGKFVIAYGIFHLVSSILGMGTQVWILGLENSSWEFSYNIMMVLNLLGGFFRFTGIILLLVGLYQLNHIMNKKIKTLKIWLILTILAGIFNLLSSYFVSFLMMGVLDQDPNSFSIIMSGISFFLMIPSNIFFVFFFLWGLELKRSKLLDNFNKFSLLFVLGITRFLVYLIGIFYVPIGPSPDMGIYYFWYIVEIFYQIGWVIVGFQINSMEKDNEPLFSNYQKQSSLQQHPITIQNKFCHDCGAVQGDKDGKFCINCGKPLIL
jgi:hypothetical protein